MEDIQNMLWEAEKLLEVAIEEYKAFVANKENSLDERWQLFLEFQKYLPDGYTYQVKFTFEDEDFSWYDNLYVERYETIELCDLIDRVREYSLEVDINTLKEEILACGYGSLEFDW